MRTLPKMPARRRPFRRGRPRHERRLTRREVGVAVRPLLPANAMVRYRGNVCARLMQGSGSWASRRKRRGTSARDRRPQESDETTYVRDSSARTRASGIGGAATTTTTTTTTWHDRSVPPWQCMWPCSSRALLSSPAPLALALMRACVLGHACTWHRVALPAAPVY